MQKRFKSLMHVTKLITSTFQSLFRLRERHLYLRLRLQIINVWILNPARPLKKPLYGGIFINKQKTNKKTFWYNLWKSAYYTAPSAFHSSVLRNVIQHPWIIVYIYIYIYIWIIYSHCKGLIAMSVCLWCIMDLDPSMWRLAILE